MTSHDSRIDAVIETLAEDLGTKDASPDLEALAALAVAILNAVDRVPHDDHVDRELVEQMLRASGDIPPGSSEDMVAARVRAHQRKQARTPTDTPEWVEKANHQAVLSEVRRLIAEVLGRNQIPASADRSTLGSAIGLIDGVVGTGPDLAV